MNKMSCFAVLNVAGLLLSASADGVSETNDWENLSVNSINRLPLVPREEVLLNLDFRQTGLGGGSCGPLPLEKYRFPIVPETWTYRFEPVP